MKSRQGDIRWPQKLPSEVSTFKIMLEDPSPFLVLAFNAKQHMRFI